MHELPHALPSLQILQHDCDDVREELRVTPRTFSNCGDCAGLTCTAQLPGWLGVSAKAAPVNKEMSITNAALRVVITGHLCQKVVAAIGQCDVIRALAQ